ncbi:hypothetical protein CCY99_06045 [Helicobacter sp. 16-1353]|uniref:sel1 repeat family protein n=1 Tax=Helicobacter sp. 16-1353 TaxID=2004996 RepID=UPI000DCD1D9A|nr:sel1 repeat family protein [Helicobacter sp. 16-1353]RAX53151.1 hypothetical protein CCY99_06045 [Helicobacter sp. 16-1353]
MKKIFYILAISAIASSFIVGCGNANLTNISNSLDSETAEILKNCDLGKANSCYALGMQYIKSHSANPLESHKSAIKYMEKSCDLGYGRGCAVLGLLYDSSLNSGTPKEILSDESKSFEYLIKACDEYEVRESCMSLERKYQYKFEDEQDPNLKNEYKQKAESYSKKAKDLESTK